MCTLLDIAWFTRFWHMIHPFCTQDSTRWRETSQVPYVHTSYILYIVWFTCTLHMIHLFPSLRIPPRTTETRYVHNKSKSTTARFKHLIHPFCTLSQDTTPDNRDQVYTQQIKTRDLHDLIRDNGCKMRFWVMFCFTRFQIYDIATYTFYNT